MFSKSQGNSKPDKAPSKQSVFPSGGNILKKKARSTLLSVLTKRQAQEKFFLGDKTDGREQQNSTVSSVEQSLHQPKWSSEAMIVDLGADLASTKSKPQRPGPVEAKSLSYDPFETSNQNWASITSNDKVSRAKSNEQIDEETTHFVENAVVEQDLEQNTNERKLSSGLPPGPLYVDRGQTDPSFQSLGNRRNLAPRHLPCPEDGDVSQAMVVSMSPSYTSVKDITPSSPLSPKSVSDSVKVSIPFQVHGQEQSSRPEQQPSPVWSSTVSVCVPFQVNEHGTSVPVSCPFDNQLLLTSLLDKQTTQQVPRTSSVPLLQEPLNSPSSNTVSVSAPTMKSDTENAYSSAMDKMSSSEPLFQMKSSSFLSPDDVETLSQDMTDGGISTKPRSHSSPAPGKRKPLKESQTKDNQVSKEQSSKTMGKEASKHKTSTDQKPVNSTAQKVPTGGKPRARSFGDKNKLTPGPSHSPSSPAGSPRSRSPASSPKLMRRNVTPAKDVSKGRNSTRKTAEPKKQEHNNRPYSDPLIGEKILGKKKLSGVAANDAGTTGKAKPDLEAVKSSSKKVQELEGEKLELQEKIQGMEHRLAVVPLLEKEKLHLQKQFNELVQENEKKLAELQSLNLETEKQRKENDELQLKQEELMKAVENSQKELEQLKDQNHLLEESKSTLVRENEEKMQSITKYLEDVENLTSSNTVLVLQESRLRSTISTLLQGLKTLKDSVTHLKEENKGLQSQIIENGSELVGRMRNCVNGLEKVIDGLEKDRTGKVEKGTQVTKSVETLDKDTQCDELSSVHLEELEENKSLLESLKRRINELEKQKETSELALTPNVAIEQNVPAICLGCASLEEQLTSLKSNVDSLQAALQKSESDRTDAVQERNELRREAKYLKYVLSYREDVQSLQVSQQQNKDLEKMESNLVDAEKKVTDLEEEVGRLYQEKQTLLLSILNLHSGHEVHEVDDVKEEDEEEEEENMASEESESNYEDQDKGSLSEGARTPDSISRREQLKFRFQLSLTESDYSFSSEQRTEGEEESESEEEQMDKEITVQTGLNIKNIKTENKQLKSRLSEATEEKEELLSSLDKLCEEYDSLKANFDKLEEENAVLSRRSKNDKDTFQARLKEVEIDRENMRDSLRQVQDEKLALLKCLEMRNPEPRSPLSPLTQIDLDNIIARAQSFTQEENKSNEPTSNEEDSEGSSSSDTEDEQTNKAVLQTTPDNRVRLEGQLQVTPTAAHDRALASLVASIENDLGKLKERLNRRGGDTSDDLQDESTGKGVDARPRKPPPGERMLKRQASTVKSNLDRVCRERQHLQDEVESLRRYLLKRRDSAMEIRKKRSHGSLKRAADEVENHLEGIKTLQALLGKSDEQLRQSNEIISRLEAVNDETEEKLRDAELLKHDMRRAVEIANNFAMEEQEKAENLMFQNQELLKTIEMLKCTRSSADQSDKEECSMKPTGKGKSKFQLTESKGFSRSVSEDDGLYPDDESNFTTEGESDFYSSRHSSIASESDFVRSPTSGDENLDSFNSNVPPESPAKNGDTECEGTSQYSSTADTQSDVTDDETE